MKTSTSNKINKALDKVYAATQHMQELLEELQTQVGAMTERFENMSEKKQESETGELLKEQIEELESTISNLEDLCNGMEYGEDYRIVID